MANLVRNVHVRDHGWFGPAHGNASDVPPEVAALITSRAVWDPTEFATSQEQSPTGNGGGETQVEPPAGLPGAAQAGTGGDVPAAPAPDFGWLAPDTVAGLQTEALSAVAQLLADLAELPDDLGDLLAFAELHDLAVTGEHSDAAALRAALVLVITGE